MAEKLSITIALEGAQEIKRQLADVGQAGKDCFNDINKAAADVGGFNKLDPSVVTAKLEQTGVAAKDVGKVLSAVNQAGRMETLVNGIAAVENGFVKVQAAASSLDTVLLKGLVSSLSKVARLLPAAFAAAVVGSIASTTKAILELDAAAIKAGVSIETMSKAQEIFKAIGISSKTAAEGVADLFENMKVQNVKDAIAALDEFGRPLRTDIRAMEILRDAAAGFGEAADLATKALAKFGQVPRLSVAAEEINRIKQSTEQVPDKILKIIAVLQTMGNTAERNRIILQTFGTEIGTALIQAANAGVPLINVLGKIPGATQPAAAAATRLALEWQKFKTAFLESFTVSPAGLDAIATTLANISEWAALAGQALASLGMSNVFANTIRELTTIGQMLTTIANFGASMWDGIVQGAAAAWQTVIGWIDKAIQKLREFFGAGGGQTAGAGADAGGFARGGLMGGRGSGTSDSNLAWLSRGEHIMPANAVRQPGVLALLEALRRSGGNLRSVLDRMGHFALGGMVGAPAFAAGGVNGMSHVTIQFPGLNPIGGLRAPGSVVDELRKAAGLAQVRSGGRKPSRYF